MHYVEPFYGASYRGETKQLLDFWPMAVPILKMLRLTGSLIEYARASCELRIEAYLNPTMSLPITTVATSVPASAQVSSHNLPASALEITVNLMYQLRWPFGKEPAPTIDDVRRIVGGLVRDV